MAIQNLPGGRDFKLSVGPGNFTRKLSSATIRGKFQNLRDNRESIVKALKSYAPYIRRGQFGRLSQRKALTKVKEAEGEKLTRDDKRDIKEIFKYLGGDGQSEALKAKKEQAAETIQGAAKQSEAVEAKKERAEKLVQEAAKPEEAKPDEKAAAKPAFKPAVRLNRAPGEEPSAGHLTTAFDRPGVARRVDSVNRSATIGQALNERGTGLAGNNHPGAPFQNRTGLAGNSRPGSRPGSGPSQPPTPPRTRISLSV